MEDLDKARRARIAADHRFIIGGETFTRVGGAPPEALYEWETIDAQDDSREVLRIIDATIVSLIADPDGAERWKRLRDVRGDESLTLADMQEVAKFLVTAVTGHPTEGPSDSSDGPQTPTGETPSTDVSSSPVVAASTDST